MPYIIFIYLYIQSVSIHLYIVFASVCVCAEQYIYRISFRYHKHWRVIYEVIVVQAEQRLYDTLLIIRNIILSIPINNWTLMKETQSRKINTM